MSKINSFTKTVNFSNRYSLHNIVENIHVIEERETDFDDQLFDFILEKCEFVVIIYRFCVRTPIEMGVLKISD